VARREGREDAGFADAVASALELAYIVRAMRAERAYEKLEFFRRVMESIRKIPSPRPPERRAVRLSELVPREKKQPPPSKSILEKVKGLVKG